MCMTLVMCLGLDICTDGDMILNNIALICLGLGSGSRMWGLSVIQLCFYTKVGFTVIIP